MERPQPNIRPLFRKAVALDRQGDVYTAVKIYKKLIKLAPNWSPPYQYLSSIYKYHNDWKAAFHYGQRAIENGADKPDTWRNFAIAATALKKWKIARNAWNKVGFQLKESKKAPNFDMGLVPVRLRYDNFQEIVWAKQIGPARAIIESIPDPVSDRNYGDTILIDFKVTGYRIVKGKKVPVYDELELVKRSHYRTFLVFLHDAQKNEANLLDRLCFNNDLGFDNWSHLNEMQLNKNLRCLPEYYNEDLEFNMEGEELRIAIAAEQASDVEEVMRAWTAISLKSYEILGM
ncbi:MAG: hypothetical protein AAF960_23295 [Bacteroidota bacterium]